MSAHEHVRAFGSPFCAGCGYYIGLPEQTSPSRARPSDRAIAQAFWHAAEFPLAGLDAAAFAAAVAVRAETIDSAAPEARAGDCELADDLAMFATMIREAANGQGELPNIWHIDDWLTRYRTHLTTKATP